MALHKDSWSAAVLSLLRRLDSFSESELKPHCVPLSVNDEIVGILMPSVVIHLQKFPDIFHFVKSESNVSMVFMKSSLSTYALRSKAMKKVVEKLSEENVFETLRLWRYEDYEISSGPGKPSLFKLERAATSLFGVRVYGSHMNGYVRHPEKGICLWLARRSPNKQTFPGMLDNLAAGGIGVGHGIRETMIKESFEEAGIPKEVAEKMISVGCTSYTYESANGISMELQYCFDLELPIGFFPKPMDGEVQEFMLCNVEEVKQLIIQDDFKPNSAGVTLHFLIRHGFVTPDNEPNYAEITKRMNNWC